MAPEDAVRRIVFLLLLTGAITVSANPQAHADRAFTFTHTAHPGELIKVGNWTYFDSLQSCEPGQPPAIREGTAPRLGRISGAVEKMHSARGCESVLLPGAAVYYQAGSATGTDTFQYYVRFPHDPPGTFTVTETVKIQ